MHIVHSLASGSPTNCEHSKAVLGILFDSSRDLPCHFLNTLSTKSDSDIDLQGLLGIVSKEVYHYQGSLTTPPCSEIVNWFVFKKPLDISKKQVEELAAIWEIDLVGKCNARDIQATNGRMIYRNFKIDNCK
eukprot:TRINITY_DN6620_c0_g2_i6.p2 TRINITY_DN6620_c0_g2~~TRINITY_DN6620_c0_g2_i6.p2  ORF type:complete len:132 (+),score=20.53 TRINITY_DN6620_c0_g2_i6:608-1003(+)